MYLQVYFKSGVLVFATCAADPHSGEIELKDQHFTQCPLPRVYSCLATVLGYLVRLNTNIYFFQSTDSRGSESSHSFSPDRGVRGRKGRKTRRSSDSEESDVADMNTKTKKSAQDKKSLDEPKKGTYICFTYTICFVFESKVLC